MSTTFNICIKPNGERLIFNIPKEAINKDCTTKENYRDYLLSNNYKNMHKKNSKALLPEIQVVGQKARELFKEVQKKIGDMLDVDKALDNLTENSENKDDALSRFLNRPKLMDDLLRELKE